MVIIGWWIFQPIIFPNTINRQNTTVQTGRCLLKAEPEDLPSMVFNQLAFGGKAVDVRTTGAICACGILHLSQEADFSTFFFLKTMERKAKHLTAMKKQMLLGAAVILASSIYGQRKDSAQTNLDEVIVTANKTAQKQSQTGKVVTVINKQEIEKSVSKTVGQLLNEQAGLIVNGSLNSLGTNQSIYMRGASAGRTLILIDGIPVSDPSQINNDFDLNLISLNEVERIEICKGAQSTLYGSDAIGGAINIITTKNDVSKPLNVKATLAGGNLGTFKGNAQVYGKSGGLTYVARYARLSTDGFSAANDKTGAGNFDNDGYHSNAYSAMLKYDINKQFAVKTFVQSNRYNADLDAGQFKDDKAYTEKNKSLITGASFYYKTDLVSVTANYQYSDVTRNLLDDSTYTPGTLAKTDYYGKSQFVELYSTIKLSKNFSLLQGADYRNNKMNLVSFGTYPASMYGPAGTYGSTTDSGISQASLYASLTYTGLQNKLNIDLGGRLNVNSRYGSNTSYSFNPSYTINEHFRVLGSISSAYKTPSVYELYSSYGNRSLQVEESKSYELGLQYNQKSFTNRLVYFYRNINNAIDFNNVTSKYFNINQQIVRGLEYEINIKPTDNLSITGNYTFLSANEYTQNRVNPKIDTGYNYLLKRPKHSINATVGYQITKKFSASISGKYVSKRYDLGGYRVLDAALDNYFILNAYAEYAINANIKLFATGQNLTNRKFVEIYGYNSIPFIFNAGATFRF